MHAVPTPLTLSAQPGDSRAPALPGGGCARAHGAGFGKGCCDLSHARTPPKLITNDQVGQSDNGPHVIQ